MKYRVFASLTMLALLFGMVGVQPVNAAAYGTPFATSVTYQNVGTETAVISIDFYPEENATPITIPLPNLAANAGSSFFVGNLSQVASGFMGSAVMSSTQPLVATSVQAAQGNPAIKARALSNGFSGGVPQVLVPTVLKNGFGYTSIVSIQNADTEPADLTVEFIPTSGTSFTLTVEDLPAGSAKIYDMGTLSHASLGATFSGSMRVTSKKANTATPGSIVASSMESGVSSNLVYSFEGAVEPSTTLFMPSAFCKYLGVNYTSTYAVQNVGTSPINITVTYDNGNSETYSGVAGGAKASIPGCGINGNLNPAGYIGSASISSTGPIVGMAKISNQQGLLTAFLGFNNGADKIALPFIRWTEAQWASGNRSRAVLAIQNIGGALPAGSVKVTYYDKNGAPVKVHTLGAIPAGGKTNSNPYDAGAGPEFGYYADGTYGGSALVEGPAGSQLAVIVRISTGTGGNTLVGEDYNGFPID